MQKEVPVRVLRVFLDLLYANAPGRPSRHGEIQDGANQRRAVEEPAVCEAYLELRALDLGRDEPVRLRRPGRLRGLS
jgi:hypothetical protein